MLSCMQRVAVSYGSTPFGVTVVAYVMLHVVRYTPDSFRGIVHVINISQHSNARII